MPAKNKQPSFIKSNIKDEDDIHNNKNSKNGPPKPSFKILYIIGAIFLFLAGSMQFYIIMTTFYDPRIPLLHKHIETFNITSLSKERTVSAVNTISLVPGHETGNEHNKDGAVLGVTRLFRKGETVLSFPFDSFVDPNAKGTFIEAVVKNAEWNEQRRGYPLNIFGLATWVLAETKRKEETGDTSRWSSWLEAVQKSDKQHVQNSNNDGISGKGAFHWDAGKTRSCVSEFFARDFNETIQLVPKLEEALGFICVDEDIKQEFNEHYLRLLCDSSNDNDLRVTEDDLKNALDIVNRRSIMNQALLPLFDFHEITIQQNVGLRVNSRDKELEIVALTRLEPGTPIRFQRFLGRIDAFMRTGYHYHTLGLEAVTLMMGREDEHIGKICHERAGQLVFNERGENTPALEECVGLLTVATPIVDDFGASANAYDEDGEEEMRRRMSEKKLTKAQKKLKARFVKNPAAEIRKNRDLRKWIRGNLSIGVNEKLKMLNEGADLLEKEEYCKYFEPFRQETIDIYTKAVDRMKQD